MTAITIGRKSSEQKLRDQLRGLNSRYAKYATGGRERQRKLPPITLPKITISDLNGEGEV